MTYLKFYRQVSESFSPSLYADQVHSEECELSGFVAAVTASWAEDAYVRMMRGKAQFRAVLTM